MGGLFKGMTGGQALGMGQNMLGMGLETMFKQQAMDIEKQKMDLTKMLQKAEMKMAQESAKRQKITFDQQQKELKKKEEYLNKMGQLLGDLFDEEGNVNKDVAQKAMALQAANTGQISKAFTDIFMPKEQRPLVVQPEGSVYDPETRDFKQAPAKTSVTEKEIKTEHDRRVKRNYDALMDDWNKNAAMERKKGKDPGVPNTVSLWKEAEARASQEERWLEKGKPYTPPKAGISFSAEGVLRNPQTGQAISGTPKIPGPWLENPLQNLAAPFRVNPLSQTGALGWWGKMLGAGPNYKLGGRPATPIKAPGLPLSKPQPPAGPTDIGEDIYVSMRSGLASEEELRKEYRAMKRAQ